MEFSKLVLNNWRQFDSVEIELTNQTTILTGANGCGKTTILNVLSHHFGWGINFVSTPFIGKKRKKRFYSDMRKMFHEESNSGAQNVGQIIYSNGQACGLVNPSGVSENPQYQLAYNGRVNVVGMHIPSHRPAIAYHQVPSIPTNPKTVQQQYQEFQQLMLQTYGSANVRNPGTILKQSLISLALFGEGNDHVVGNTEFQDLFDEFQSILKILLPSHLGFQKIEIRMPDVVLLTSSGDFSLDAMSGGVGSIFGIAWQIHMYTFDKANCTVIIDEPENHLHPSMQRTLLPSLEKAFPRCKFIVATHSPFIVTSNPKAGVYGLKANEKGHIFSEHLKNADLAASPDRVLREVLDVPTTVPVWVEDSIKEVLRKYSSDIDNEAKVNAIYSELKELGLSDSLFDFTDNSKD